MKQEELKQRLIELYEDCMLLWYDKASFETIADHLIANGVTIRGRGEWVRSDIPEERYVCSVCGGACWYYDYEGEVSKSKYCHNCGADLRGVKDE